MTDEPNDGGSAFPYPSEKMEDGQPLYPPGYGMSLRDWFAGQALMGLIASNDHEAGDRIDELPCYSYHIADAMLKERKGDQS